VALVVRSANFLWLNYRVWTNEGEPEIYDVSHLQTLEVSLCRIADHDNPA